MSGLRHGQTREDDRFAITPERRLTLVSGRCTYTGEMHSIYVRTTELDAWLAGGLIQTAMPHASPEDREFLISGTSPDGWLELNGERVSDAIIVSDPDGLRGELRDECHYIVLLRTQGGRRLQRGYRITHCFATPSGQWDVGYQMQDKLAQRFMGVDDVAALHAQSSTLSECTLEVRAVKIEQLCSDCGNHVADDGYSHVKGDRTDLCHSCHFWRQKYTPQVMQSALRADAHHYQLGPEGARPSFRGFGGSRFVFEMLDDKRRIVSTNCWTQGIIPPHFRERLPDNARVVPYDELQREKQQAGAS